MQPSQTSEVPLWLCNLSGVQAACQLQGAPSCHQAQCPGWGARKSSSPSHRPTVPTHSQCTSKGWQPLSQDARGTGLGAVKVMPAPSGMVATMLPCSPQLRSCCACTRVPARGRGQGWGGQAGWYLGAGEWATENPPWRGRKAAGGRTNVS